MTWNKLTPAQQTEIRDAWRRCRDAAAAYEVAGEIDPGGLAPILADRLWDDASRRMAVLTLTHGLSVEEIRANV